MALFPFLGEPSEVDLPSLGANIAHFGGETVAMERCGVSIPSYRKEREIWRILPP